MANIFDDALAERYMSSDVYESGGMGAVMTQAAFSAGWHSGIVEKDELRAAVRSGAKTKATARSRKAAASIAEAFDEGCDALEKQLGDAFKSESEEEDDMYEFVTNYGETEEEGKERRRRKRREKRRAATKGGSGTAAEAPVADSVYAFMFGSPAVDTPPAPPPEPRSEGVLSSILGRTDKPEPTSAEPPLEQPRGKPVRSTSGFAAFLDGASEPPPPPQVPAGVLLSSRDRALNSEDHGGRFHFSKF